MRLPEIDDALVFNVRAKNDSLRNENCRKIFSYSTKLFYSLRCPYSVFGKKKWKKWFLITGPDKNDKIYSDALKNSAKKFNIKIKKKKSGTSQQI